MEKIDYIEFYVADLQKALQFYKDVFQCIPIAEYRDAAKWSIVLKQGNVRFMLTASILPNSDITRYLKLHGDGVKNIAFLTTDITKKYEHALINGAKSILAPTVCYQDDIEIIQAKVSAFGDVIHTLIQRNSNDSFALPRFNTDKYMDDPEKPLFHTIDHIAVCVPKGELATWSEYYRKMFGFLESHQEYVTTTKGGMNSIVVESQNGNIKMVLIEPIDGNNFSHIDEFLDNFGGSGVQHIALRTEHIITTITALKNNGLNFLSISEDYYETRKGAFRNGVYNLKTLSEHSILTDGNDIGVLYQIFSQPIFQKTTLFFEIIERHRFDGFGSHNINALFHTVESQEVGEE